MNKRQKAKLASLAGERLRFDCPMAQYTTFGVGGQAEALYEATSPEGIQRMIAYLNEENIPYFVVGLGSNLLVKDDGFEGLVMLLRGSLAVLKQGKTDDPAILAGAGLPIADLLVYCRSSGLGGLEFLAGIPGTVGGAVAMNAGAFGKDIGAKVKEIHVINSQGDLVVIDRPMLRFSYRELEIENGSVIIRVRLRLEREPGEIVAKRISGCLKWRKERQPLEYPSAGSVFKNPPDDYAGRLLEKAGLKGKRIGGAMISEKHANYIVNTGGARVEDILALIFLAQEQVERETGIQLQPEIKVIGN